MNKNWILLGLVLAMVLLSGCTGTNQDEDFKGLVKNVSADFQGQEELIIKPDKGITPDELRQYKSAASSAITAAESMTLSDKSAKARGIFIQGMNATITAVDTLDKAGKLTGSEERVSTGSVNTYIITSQSKIDDTYALLGMKREKSN